MGTAVIGSSDAQAEERAELVALRDQAVMSRKELGETVAAVAGRLTSANAGAWMRQTAAAAARRAAHGARAALGRAVRSHPWPVVAAGAGTSLFLAAAAWRVTGLRMAWRRARLDGSRGP